jgi:hypothetical protein
LYSHSQSGDEACPVDALQKLLLLDPKGAHAPLFSFHRRIINRNNFLSTLSTELRALGLQTDGYSGHSFFGRVRLNLHTIVGSSTTKFKRSGDGPRRLSGCISRQIRQTYTSSITSSRQARRLNCLYWLHHRPLHHPSLARLIWALSAATI